MINQDSLPPWNIPINGGLNEGNSVYNMQKNI